jgi:hypothetical protein
MGAAPLDFEAALAWLQRRGERVQRASRGATDAELDDVEQRLGMPLPRSYRAFLRQHNWIDLRLAKVLGVCPDVPHLDIATQMDVVRRFTARIVSINPAALAQAEVLRTLVPAVAMGGNTIPHGFAIAFDSTGRFYMSAHKEFSSCEPACPIAPQPDGFESLFVQQTLEMFAASLDDDDHDETSE